MAKCTINGKQVEVKDGTSIIQAMNDHGLRIAHYCWHPGLSVAGVCRTCMVEVEGNPRLQIACNTVVTDGMVINNTSPKVKEAVKWGLDFHLINHPLDCPICDQAGECGLQDQYMEYGKYDPEMAEKKVKKHKVVDLGPTVVLDSERCILCSRCVRFTKEVSKTEELGIFNRGDRSEIGTVDGKTLDNQYSLNTVDICPVGALTSKDFRFRQRVWYLKDGNSICTGCSTGCNVKVYFNKEGVFRVKPVFNEQVNGHWMCDDGRDIYKFVNRDFRFVKGLKIQNGTSEEMMPGAVAKDAASVLKASKPEEVALVLTAQYTVEEFEAIVSAFIQEYKTKNIYYWVNNVDSFDSFDGLLIRGDKNPNTVGLLKVLEKHGVTATWSQLQEALKSGKVKTLVVAAPENPVVYPDMQAQLKNFALAAQLIWLGSAKNDELLKWNKSAWVIPMKTFVEKEGTFINHAGLEQKFKKVTTVVSEALTLSEAAQLLTGQQLMVKPDATGVLVEAQRPADRVMLENRKKNEFVFRRGSL
jgi:NADH-quinone oxidoreductase subunit G